MTDHRYNVIITGLMILIIFTLAGLWIMEWGKRRTAENDLNAYLEQDKNVQMIKLRDLLAKEDIDALVRPVDRSTLKPVKVEWCSRDVLVLDGVTAKTLGFGPGDVIWVSQPGAESGPAESR
jgi:hypothetical protein